MPHGNRINCFNSAANVAVPMTLVLLCVCTRLHNKLPHNRDSYLSDAGVTHGFNCSQNLLLYLVADMLALLTKRCCLQNSRFTYCFDKLTVIPHSTSPQISCMCDVVCRMTGMAGFQFTLRESVGWKVILKKVFFNSWINKIL